MFPETLYIKNMVCDRCISVVAEDLRKLNIPFKQIQLGEVVLLEPIDQKHKKNLSWQLGSHGFELVDHENTVIIEEIKELIVEIVNDNSPVCKKSYVHLIADKFLLDSQQINTLFESVKCLSLKKYIDLQKVERVKEFLSSDNLSVNQIADKLEYRNTQHLSNQFIEITGMTPARYKRLRILGSSF